LVCWRELVGWLDGWLVYYDFVFDKSDIYS